MPVCFFCGRVTSAPLGLKALGWCPCGAPLAAGHRFVGLARAREEGDALSFDALDVTSERQVTLTICTSAAREATDRFKVRTDLVRTLSSFGSGAVPRFVAALQLPARLFDGPGQREGSHPRLRPCLVTEPVGGSSLGDLIATGGTDEHAAALVVRGVARAIGCIHRRGFAVGPYSPGDVVIARGGDVVFRSVPGASRPASDLRRAADLSALASLYGRLVTGLTAEEYERRAL